MIEPQLRYDGLGPTDTELMTAFLKKYGGRYEKAEYNIRVGQGLQLGKEYTESIRIAAKALTQHRIDACFWDDKRLYIAEAKAYAGTTALGQLLTYEILYRKTYHYKGPIQLILITDSLQPDMEEVFTAYNIDIFLV